MKREVANMALREDAISWKSFATCSYHQISKAVLAEKKGLGVHGLTFPLWITL